MFQKIPLLPRLLIGFALLALGLWIGVKLFVKLAIDDMVDSAAMRGQEIDYDAKFIQWNGDFGITGVRTSGMLPTGEEVEFSADRLVIHTPGLPWLIRQGFTGGSDELPDDIGITVENFASSNEDDRTKGNYTNLPYDAVGCGTDLLTPAELEDIGFDELHRNLTMRLTRIDDKNSNLKFQLDTRGVGRMSIDLKVGLDRPVEWEQGPRAFVDAKLEDASLTFTDHGFVAARNKFCAEKAGVTAEAWGDFHMKALQRRTAEEGVTYGIETLDRYRKFATEGGELLISSIGDTKATLGEFAMMERVGQLRSFRTGIRHNGGPLATLVVGTQPKVVFEDEEEAAPEALATAATTDPAAPGVVASESMVVSAGVAKAGTVADDPTGGQVIPYAQLEKHVGQRAELTTAMGSVRRGRILTSNPWQTEVMLDKAEGGFKVIVIADQVVQVRLLPAEVAAPAAPAAPAAAPN